VLQTVVEPNCRPRLRGKTSSKSALLPILQFTCSCAK